MVIDEYKRRDNAIFNVPGAYLMHICPMQAYVVKVERTFCGHHVSGEF